MSTKIGTEGGEQRVSLLGAPGSYHDIACDYLSPDSNEEDRIRCTDFPEILDTLATGKADRAVMAIANSEIGALWDSYDIISRHDVFATGEVSLRIKHNLLVLPEVESLDDIKVVNSNPKAIKQCEKYLGEMLPEAKRLTGADTASCARDVAELGDPSHAAIASRQAAEVYDLKVLAESIETNPRNQTRFWQFERNTRDVPEADKTSVILATSNRPRALYDALGVWATLDIGLSMLESRLMPHQVHSPWGALLHAQGEHELIEKLREDDPIDDWDAHFYIDIDSGLQNPSMRAALGELALQDGTELRILGSYRKGELVE